MPEIISRKEAREAIGVAAVIAFCALSVALPLLGLVLVLALASPK